MRKVSITITAGLLALSGCASEFSVPVTGEVSGQPAAGQATARMSGKGDFWVQIPGGMKCGGDYDALNTQPTIVVPVWCGDGRKGEAVITRQMDMVSGTAIVSLTDGTKGQFVFGNIKFDQAFGTARATTAQRTVIR